MDPVLWRYQGEHIGTGFAMTVVWTGPHLDDPNLRVGIDGDDTWLHLQDGRVIINSAVHHGGTRTPWSEPWGTTTGGTTVERRCAACGHTEDAHRWDPPEERTLSCTCGCPSYTVRPELPPVAPVPIGIIKIGEGE